MKKYAFLIILCLFFIGSAALAGEADVVKVEIDKNSDNSYNFTVTVLHNDTGWKHYADKWEVIDEKSIVLGTRILHHPHVNEQPFSRNLSGVKIPDIIKMVTVRAHDSVHKYGGKVVSIELP